MKETKINYPKHEMYEVEHIKEELEDLLQQIMHLQSSMITDDEKKENAAFFKEMSNEYETHISADDSRNLNKNLNKNQNRNKNKNKNQNKNPNNNQNQNQNRNKNKNKNKNRNKKTKCGYRNVFN